MRFTNVSYENSGAGFLSVYMASKLDSGGSPEVTIEELNKAQLDFLASWPDYSFEMAYGKDADEIIKIKDLKFDSIEELACEFEAKAKKTKNSSSACFKIEGDKLIPTYEFYDFQNEHNALGNFLRNYKFPKSVNTKETKTSTENTKAATVAAKYLTKFYAQKYIEQGATYGIWPIHMANPSSIFKKDLGSILGLKGTKKYFIDFYQHLRLGIAKMLSNANGQLILSNHRLGNLKYNNLRRLIGNGYNMFNEMNHSHYYCNNREKMFNLEIKNGTVNVNEIVLSCIYPYDEINDSQTKTLNEDEEVSFQNNV